MFRIGAKNRENTFCGKALVRIRAKIEKNTLCCKALHYSVDVIFFSFGIMGFIVEL